MKMQHCAKLVQPSCPYVRRYMALAEWIVAPKDTCNVPKALVYAGNIIKQHNRLPDNDYDMECNNDMSKDMNSQENSKDSNSNDKSKYQKKSKGKAKGKNSKENSKGKNSKDNSKCSRSGEMYDYGDIFDLEKLLQNKHHTSVMNICL